MKQPKHILIVSRDRGGKLQCHYKERYAALSSSIIYAAAYENDLYGHTLNSTLHVSFSMSLNSDLSLDPTPLPKLSYKAKEAPRGRITRQHQQSSMKRK